VRIDSSEHFLGLRLNMYIAIALTLAGLVWFVLAQRRPDRPVVLRSATDSPAQGAGQDLAETPRPVQKTKKRWNAEPSP